MYFSVHKLIPLLAIFYVLIIKKWSWQWMNVNLLYEGEKDWDFIEGVTNELFFLIKNTFGKSKSELNKRTPRMFSTMNINIFRWTYVKHMKTKLCQTCEQFSSCSRIVFRKDRFLCHLIMSRRPVRASKSSIYILTLPFDYVL
jgi:hypothetical protein